MNTSQGISAYLVTRASAFRWEGGMLPLIREDGEYIAQPRIDLYQPEGARPPEKAVPDLEDPATLGCLREQVRRKMGRAHYTAHYSARTNDWGRSRSPHNRFDSEGEIYALILIENDPGVITEHIMALFHAAPSDEAALDAL